MQALYRGVIHGLDGIYDILTLVPHVTYLPHILMAIGALILVPFLWVSSRNHLEDTERGIVPNDEEDHDDADNTEEEVDEDVGDEPSHEIQRGLTTRPPSLTARTRSETTIKPSWFSRFKTALFGNPEEDQDEGYIPNYRLTPIFSGVMIPFSILLEIPGLTGRWYIRTEGNTIVETRPNTVILDVGLGFSMFCAVVANICVVLRFLEKGEVKKMTILAIIALTIHGVFPELDSRINSHCLWIDAINIITVIVFGVEHRFDDGFTYGPSYWVTGKRGSHT